MNSPFFDPVPGKPFIMYVRAMNHALSTLPVQVNDEGHKQII